MGAANHPRSAPCRYQHSRVRIGFAATRPTHPSRKSLFGDCKNLLLLRRAAHSGRVSTQNAMVPAQAVQRRTGLCEDCYITRFFLCGGLFFGFGTFTVVVA